jgi:murein DD-endopeptidase MepM/ murein hydrolase activator NlpD
MLLKTKHKKHKLNIISVLFLSAFLVLFPLFTAPISAEESVEELNEEVSDRKEEIEKLESQVSTLETEIAKKQEEERNLQNQIAILDGEIEKAEKQIEETELEIETTKVEIEQKEKEIKQKEKEIKSQKEVLAEFIRMMYQYDQNTSIELILAYDSFSEYLDQLQYLETLENKGQETLEKIQKLKEELAWQKQALETKKVSLEELAKKLEEMKSMLDQEKEGRQRLLEETQAQEEKYQELLQRAREEQENINIEIQNLEQEIRKQFSQKSDTNFDWQSISGDGTLAWPVNPYRGISAYFMDSSYYALFGINHYAIDIPTPQGTPIHAPADGYTIRYRDAGYGYSYIVLLHANGISTVYGHVSASFVSEGAYVRKGQMVGLTGGMPGTWGAGWLTTGPHLHFEVRINGVPVNPLNYLPSL